jgi:Rieske Fe-S protein
MNRRDFVRRSCVACLGATALGPLLALEGCAPTLFATGRLNNNGVMLDLKEFVLPSRGREQQTFRSYVVVRHDDLAYPIGVFRQGPAEFTALWLQCSHLGAELQVSGEALQCPAHGSEFSNRGAVTNGPADVPLRTFPVTVDNQELFIDLRRPV